MRHSLSTYFSEKNTYRFDHRCQFPVSAEIAWQTLADFKAWPGWWEGLSAIESLTPAVPLGEGSRIRSTWKGPLPYALTFDAEIRTFYPHFSLSFSISGDLEGEGRCRFISCPDSTRLHFSWKVCPTPFWLRMSAPFARSIYRENHDLIMAQAVRGMEQLFSRTPAVN